MAKETKKKKDRHSPGYVYNYTKTNYKRYAITIQKNKYKHIIDYLDSIEMKTQYIIGLIEKDIKNKH